MKTRALHQTEYVMNTALQELCVEIDDMIGEAAASDLVALAEP